MNAGDGSRGNTGMLVGIVLILVAGAALVALIWTSWAQLSPAEPAASEPTETVAAPAQATAISSDTPTQQLPPPQVEVIGGPSPEPVPTEAAPELEPTEAEPEAEPTQEPTTPPEPTPAPTETGPAEPHIIAGSRGVNVRSGPGTNYARIDGVAPNDQAPITGRYGDWWRVQVGGRAGWVYSGVVTAVGTENVPQVSPPPAPTAAPQPTPVPQPTAPPAAPDTRGIIADAFWVEGAPGPYATNGQIWFNWVVRNTAGGEVLYSRLGAWVQETGFHKDSWTDSSFSAGERHEWRDWFPIGSPGTYHIWLRICFTDGYCVNLAGPTVVNIN